MTRSLRLLLLSLCIVSLVTPNTTLQAHKPTLYTLISEETIAKLKLGGIAGMYLSLMALAYVLRSNEMASPAFSH